MRPMPIIARTIARARAFRRSREGNVSVLFAAALIPVVGMIGAAIDYSRASSIRAAMQAALDATALALSKEAATLSADALNAKAAVYFSHSFNRADAGEVKITAAYSSAGGSAVTVTGNASFKTHFLGIIGIDQIPIAASAKTAWGGSKLRVALVLDNSGSMASGGRMTALKAASRNLLNMLQSAADSPDDVKVAIIPFTQHVNVGANNYTASWIDWEDWDDDNGQEVTLKSCASGKIGKDGKTKKKCANSTTWVPADHKTWNGCVSDRDQNYDVLNTAPSPSQPATLFPAEQASPCPVALMGLTHDFIALRAKVDAMLPNGYTNQPIGLAWGWHALTQGPPMQAPGINDKTTKTFIILLSDGENTRNRWYEGSGAEAKINARQKLVCDNIKQAGIQIFSILMIEGNAQVMRDCASSAGMFFHLTAPDQVIGAFNAIGTKLTKLRLTQ